MMTDTLDLEPETKPDTAAKRVLIETELRSNPNRSDREIARLVGADHKTVGAQRAKLLPTASPPISPQACPPPPGVVDEPKENFFGPDSDSLVIPHQPAIAIYENAFGSVVIRQEADYGFDDEDRTIYVRPEHVEKLVARLRLVAKQAME